MTSETPVSLGSDTVVAVVTPLEATPGERFAHPRPQERSLFPLILFKTKTPVTTVSDPTESATSNVTVVAVVTVRPLGAGKTTWHPATDGVAEQD